MTHLLTLLRALTASAVGLFLTALPALAESTELPNPLGTNSIEDLIVTVSQVLVSLVGVAATFMFIYGGIMMMTSAGSPDRITNAQNVLKYTAIALIIIFFSAAIVRFVLSGVGANDTEVPDEKIGLGSNDLVATVTNTLRFLLGALGIAGVTMLIYGGYMWLTAGGSEERVESAVKIIRAAVVGILIIAFSWVIVSYVLTGSFSVTATP